MSVDAPLQADLRQGVHEAAKRARRLREDLAGLEEEEFVDRWCAIDLATLDATYRPEG